MTSPDKTDPKQIKVELNQGIKNLAASPTDLLTPSPLLNKLEVEGDMQDEDQRLEILQRQVETKTKLMGQNTSA